MVKISLTSYSYKFMKVRYKKSEPALTIELIPKSCQGNSVYHKWPKKYWDRLRKLVYKRAGYVCEVCSGGPEIECHEVWEFNIEKRVQKLLYLVCLCNKCHRAKHFGRAFLTGRSVASIKHLMKVNNWSADFTMSYIESVYSNHKKYKGIKFKNKLDLNLLSDFIDIYKIKNRRKRCVKSKSKVKKKEYRKIHKAVGNYRKSDKR